MTNRYMASLNPENLYLNNRTYDDPSTATSKVVVATGATTPISIADRFGAALTVFDFHAKGDGVTDDAPAFNRALASGRPILVPPPKVAYLTRSAIRVPAGQILKGIGRPLITYVGTVSNIGIVQSAGPGCTIEGLRIDGGNKRLPMTPWQTYGVRITHDDCSVIGVEVQNARIGGMGFFSVRNIKVLGGCANGGSGPGLRVDNVSYSSFEGVDVSLNLSNFGIYVDQGTAYCTFEDCQALNDGTGNVSLEMLGMTYTCHDNKVLFNRAEGTGDNGISITGHGNTVMGNHAKNCKHSGIFIYGRRNTVVGNECENNNQRWTHDQGAASVFCGITVQPSWGGFGEQNTVTGNVCIDTQASPTQTAGIRIGAAAYAAWAAGAVIDDLNTAYRFRGVNLYKATTLGTTGTTATAPTHTSGTAIDGTVTWRYVGTAEVNMHAKRNIVVGNVCSGNRNGDVWHDANQANTIITDGDITIAAQDSATLSTRILSKNASPASSPGFAANQGSLFLRQGGGSGISAYLKTGAADTAWEAIMTRTSGNTAGRPALAATGYDGYPYFDTTLGKPVYRKGAVWVDATGATV
jgi:parallel beta-helix repeat protein